MSEYAEPLGTAAATPTKSRLREALLLTAGFITLGIGAIGIVVPVLPTTPFILLAATCFATSSPNRYNALLRSRLFGPYIQHYRTGGGISTARKAATIAFLWSGLIVSMLLGHRPWLIALLAVIGAGVTMHLLRLPTALSGKTDISPQIGTETSVTLARDELTHSV